MKHEHSVRPINIRLISVATVNQSAGLCLLLSMIATTVKSPGYTKTDRLCTMKKSLSRQHWIIRHVARLIVPNQNMNEKVLPWKLLRNQDDCPCIFGKVSKKREFLKDIWKFIHPYFFQFWASKKKKKMPTGYFFLETAKISQLPEKKHRDSSFMYWFPLPQCKSKGLSNEDSSSFTMALQRCKLV